MMKCRKCCICGKVFEGEGNNAEPYKKGKCCDECNANVVIPARMNLFYKNGGKKKKVWPKNTATK